MNDVRFENYLKSYELYSNSIDFRIHSSKSIEKWKNIQAFQLNQITNGKFYFQKDRKEIYLLKYDLWTRFIFEVENYIIELLNTDCPESLTEDQVNKIIALADKTNTASKKLMLEEHKNNFDQLFTQIWLESHESVYELMKKQVKSLVGSSLDISFTMIVDIISKVMQYTLLELHELNGLYCHFLDRDSCGERLYDNSVVPFLIFTKLDCMCHKLSYDYLIIARYTAYSKHFKIDDLFFKNYSEERIPRKIFEIFEAEGIDIKYKLNY